MPYRRAGGIGSPIELHRGRLSRRQRVPRVHGSLARATHQRLLTDPDPDLEGLGFHWAGLQAMVRQGLPDLYREAYDRLGADTHAALTPAQIHAVRETVQRLAGTHVS